MTEIFKPVVLESDGILGRLPDGSIVNIGGTSHNTFTVGGKGILLEDGSTTGGGSALSLNQAYINSVPENGEVRIKLTSGKDFTITDLLSNAFFKVDAETGKVSITGDLEVLGTSSVINTVIQDSDHWLISPKSGTTTALKIQPDPGVIPIVDIISVRKIFGAAPVLRLDKDGNLILTQNLNVGGLINNIDIVQLKSNLDLHLAGQTGYRHMADDVDILPIPSLTGATNVQEALEQISTKVSSSGSGMMGYEHIQAAPALQWAVVHNKATLRLTVTIYDDDLEMILPDNVVIVNGNTVNIYFSHPVSGRAILILF